MTRNEENTTEPNPCGHAPSLTIDWELYGQMLDESDWSDEQKREFIACLWSIVVGFVDLGFNIHPVQQAMNAKPLNNCGQDPVQGALPIAQLLDCHGEEQPPCR